MRIWDIPCSQLCNKHLIAEHHELHGIWSVITNNKKGYSNHPEVKRWKNNTAGLLSRHLEQTIEMDKRNMKHKSPLIQNGKIYELTSNKKTLWQPINEQLRLLKQKGCKCKVEK